MRWIDRIWPSLGLEVDPDLGARGRAVGLGADQLDFQPVVALARVLKERVVRLVARRRPAELDEEVEITVAVPVGERDSVPLLKMAGTRRRRDVLKAGCPRRS